MRVMVVQAPHSVRAVCDMAVASFRLHWLLVRHAFHSPVGKGSVAGINTVSANRRRKFPSRCRGYGGSDV